MSKGNNPSKEEALSADREKLTDHITKMAEANFDERLEMMNEDIFTPSMKVKIMKMKEEGKFDE